MQVSRWRSMFEMVLLGGILCWDVLDILLKHEEENTMARRTRKSCYIDPIESIVTIRIRVKTQTWVQTKEFKRGKRIPDHCSAKAVVAILTVMHGRWVIVSLDLAWSAQMIIVACLLQRQHILNEIAWPRLTSKKKKKKKKIWRYNNLLSKYVMDATADSPLNFLGSNSKNSMFHNFLFMV